ncbi:MAG: ATP-binding protein [Bacteroidales bacterium]|nr:ATP-binding protein [Bacteroidales bacterium]
MYRNFITVLGEAISNSWDADAKNVWIYIDRDENTLIIKDDGLGMNEIDFQNKFLKIGYSKRRDGVTQTISGRPFIGRKGIGKLALLSCAKRIHVFTKTENSKFIGGIIDNSSLDQAITDDSSQYRLEAINPEVFDSLKLQLQNGTIIYFEDVNDGIKNRIEYIRKLIALFFRFSLFDSSFKIFLNDEPITLNELNDLSLSTQFVWQINSINDPFLQEKITATREHIKQYRKLRSQLSISGFIASVDKPSNLKIRGADEKVSIDLFVNGRLREKDILKHVPTTRIVESYLYGQIHFDDLDDDIDRFTSSREGVISDDLIFKSLLKELKDNIIKVIIEDWDIWRISNNQDGDSENTRITKKERKSKELYDTVADDYTPPKESEQRRQVDGWVSSLRDDAQFNLSSYIECFVAENLLRKYIREKNVAITSVAQTELDRCKNKEEENKNKANISFDIRDKVDDLHYLCMNYLANLADMHKEHKVAALSRDATIYKPVRDAMAHTAILTEIAKQSLNTTFENIKARIKKLLE